MQIGGETKLRVLRIINDLKSSWYFRVWLVLWILLMVVWWVALGILSDHSEKASKHKVQQYYVEHESKIRFPEFRLRFKLQPGQMLSEFNCFYGDPAVAGATVPVGAIASLCEFNDTCISVASQTVEACATYSPKCNDRLVCVLNVTGAVTPFLVAWELLQGERIGFNEYAQVWIQANDAAWVLLTKEVHHDKVGWNRELVYHSANFPNTYWGIVTIINTFNVEHYEELDLYNGWQATADIGGFIMFLLIFHTFTMFIVGVFFENDSTFLRPDRKEETYNSVS